LENKKCSHARVCKFRSRGIVEDMIEDSIDVCENTEFCRYHSLGVIKVESAKVTIVNDKEKQPKRQYRKA